MGLFLFFVSYSGLVFGSSPYSALETLSSVEYKDPVLSKLREEVKENLENASQGDYTRPVFRKYYFKKKDSFFLVMTRTMLDHDTLSSVNQLASLWDVEPGRYWVIPNTRGIAVFGDPDTISERYQISSEYVTPVPGYKNLYFVPGRSFSAQEKNYLNLSVFSRPVPGKISSRYGYRKDPFHNKSKFHKGVDIACPVNTPVVAAAPGRVVYKGKMGGYGNLIIIEHQNGYQTLYGHLNTFKVKQGQKVQRGQKIAYSGNTGRSTGPHLHFEVKRKGKPMRPHFSSR